MTPHCDSCGTSQYGAGASGHTSSMRIVVARTRVPATFEITIAVGVGSFANCAGSAVISSSSAWPDSTRLSRAVPSCVGRNKPHLRNVLPTSISRMKSRSGIMVGRKGDGTRSLHRIERKDRARQLAVRVNGEIGVGDAGARALDDVRGDGLEARA